MLSSQILEFQYGALKGFFSIAVLPDWVISVEQAKFSPSSGWRGGELLLLRKVQINRSRPSPKVNIQPVSRGSSGQKLQWQNSTLGQTKEKARVCALNSQGDSLTHLYSVSYMRSSFFFFSLF